MTDRKMLLDKQDLGYYFHTAAYPNAPGHPRLDVVLLAKPSNRHFDPVRVRLEVTAANGSIRHLAVHHPWRGADRYRVSAGFVSISDRKGKAVDAFTFGGDLQITLSEDCITCMLTSPAPIIELQPSPPSSGLTVPMMLVEEVETLIAHRRAIWESNHSPATFDERLASADPLILYAACLEALHDKFSHSSFATIDGSDDRFARFLQDELATLRKQDLWPSDVPPLAELL